MLSFGTRTAVMTLLIGAGAHGCASSQGRTQDGDCSYRSYEGTCTLENVWLSEPKDGQVTIEAQYATPRSSETVRREVDADDAERWRAHLSAHRKVRCKGRVIEEGSCDPSHIEVALPALPKRR